MYRSYIEPVALTSQPASENSVLVVAQPKGQANVESSARALGLNEPDISNSLDMQYYVKHRKDTADSIAALMESRTLFSLQLVPCTPARCAKDEPFA
jgi:hypothetical protein